MKWPVNSVFRLCCFCLCRPSSSCGVYALILGSMHSFESGFFACCARGMRSLCILSVRGSCVRARAALASLIIFSRMRRASCRYLLSRSHDGNGISQRDIVESFHPWAGMAHGENWRRFELHDDVHKSSQKITSLLSLQILVRKIFIFLIIFVYDICNKIK